MRVHSTHEVRHRFPLKGPGLSLGIGVLALVGFGLTFLFPGESAVAVSETSASATESREYPDQGFAITTASWETEWDTSAPEPFVSDGQAFEAGSERAEDEPLRFEAPMVQWQNLDIAVRRDW